jgi:hypothetical protein
MFRTHALDLRFPEKLLLFVLTIFMFSEVASGLLRFYLDQFSLAQLIYVPKLLMVFVFLYTIAIEGFSKVYLSIFAAILWGGVIGLARGIEYTNILFAIYIFLPIFFGVVCGRKHQLIAGWCTRIFLILFSFLFVGLVIDYFYSVPWKGFEYQIGDSIIEGSREWSTAGVDRLAGFSRVSASAGILTAIFSAYISCNLKARWAVVLCLICAFVAISLTTNKASMLGLVCSIYYLIFRHQRINVAVLVFGLVLVGISLPFSTIFIDYDADLNSASSEFFLASFYDRLNRTWPGYIDIVSSYGFPEFGVGLGGVGAALKLFSVESEPGILLYSLAVADNTALYIWGIFGLLGFIFIAYFGFAVVKMQKMKGVEGIVGVLVAILAISITTDVVESPVCLVFVGIAFGVLSNESRYKNV